MVESARTVIQFVHGRSRADLESDEMLLFAVIRAVEILGEAAARTTGDHKGSPGTLRVAPTIGSRVTAPTPFPA